ncbi:MAG TPA: four helix bundle protein [Anaerolineae bacterium]|nr:four helix bundle protein [Anaerolineae bacterium]
MAIGGTLATFEDLQILKSAEAVADSVWKSVSRWDEFTKDVVGKQLTRAVDSIGANIAESFGRYGFGEKLQFLYYARDSLFETKYWLNRVRERGLMKPDEVNAYVENLTQLARQLNTFASGLKTVRAEQPAKKSVREPVPAYITSIDSEPLFSEEDLHLLTQ